MGCTNPNISNSILNADIHDRYHQESTPTDVVAQDSFINCLARDVNPSFYAFVGVSVKYNFKGNGKYVRLVYSCSGTSLMFDRSLSESSSTTLPGTDPIFLDSDYLREDCYSCNAAMPSNSYTCEECNVSCQIPNNTIGYCFGPSPSECCRYTHNDICVAVCPGGFTPDSNNTCTCTATCVNGNLNSTCECECIPDYFGTRCENQFLPCDTNPCVNGTCSDGIGDMVFTCDCQAGFNGSICDNNIDDCATNPCTPGMCTDGVNSYSCSCPNGYSILGNVSHPNCTDFNECDLNPCENSGNCSHFIGGYNCSCPVPYTGTNCSDCSINSCGNGTNINCNCVCYSGHFGEFCEFNINDCIPNPCLHSGVCIDGNGTNTCDCSGTYYEGVSCENEINNCVPDPCLHGQCNSSVGNYSCTCDGNYSGLNCTDCNITCDNGGSVSTSCTCECSDTGFEGERCENDIDECLLSPCLNNGTCLNNDGNYSCTCDGNYSGLNCTDCNITCSNGGNVTFSCSCDCSDTGFEGERCENDTNECLLSPCLNNGTCLNINGNYSCTCDGNYSGINCTDCNITCNNGGSVSTSCTCDCYDTGFEGERCENDIDECLLSPCLNNGTCLNTIGNYSCTCMSGFEGVNCQTDTNECDTSPCLNGAPCVNTPGDFYCDCLFGFNGSLCENVVTNCSYIECQNGGVCKQTNSSVYCDCLNLYTGAACENSLCPYGYEYNGNSCINIDECKRYTDVCGVFPAVCSDNIPLYTCSCPVGYNTNETAYSPQLSYCNSANCSPKLCIDKDECLLNSHTCHPTQECVNTNGSYICICPIGLQQRAKMCVQSVINPDCPMGIDSSGHTWPGVSRDSVVRLECVNSYYSLAERTCHRPCDCSDGPSFWGMPDVSECSFVGLQVLMAELESLDTFQELNGVTFKQTVNNIQVFATTNSILAKDIKTLLFIFQKIVGNIGKLNMTLLDRNLFINVLKIADVILATKSDAWNEIGNTFEDVLLLHDSILETTRIIAKYLYSNNPEFEFNFNSTNIQLHLITFHNYTININNYNYYKPTQDYTLTLPLINTNMLNLPIPQTPESCQVFIRRLYLPTFHQLLHSNQQTSCGDTVTRSLIFPIPLFTFGVHSVFCSINLGNFNSTFLYRINSSLLPYSISEVFYYLQVVTNYSQYQQSNSFAPSSCQGPVEDVGYLIFACHSIKDYFLTLKLPETSTPFYASKLGILLRIFFPTSAVLSLISLVLLFTRYVVLVDGMVFVRINVILTLVFSQILISIGIDRNESPIVCMVIRFLLSYMSITTIIWSLIDIINVCLITIFDSYRAILNLTYLIVGYILPLAHIIVTMSLSFCSYSRDSFFCLPSGQASENAIWYIITPLFVLLFVFVCLVVLVLIILAYKRRNIRVELTSDFKLFIRIILSSFLLPLLVIAFWISTILAYARDEAYFTFQVVSLVIGSFIGMFVLFIYVMASAEQFKPTKSGRKEEETKAFTHTAMERITFNPLFMDSQTDVHSLAYTNEALLINYTTL